jgi:PAS domain S-box-containing protein
MANWGDIESPEGDLDKPDTATIADLQAVAASLATLPGPDNFANILTIADALPVMIAYLNRDQRYLFVNRTLADWLEAPRRSILGQTMHEVLGDDAYELRRPKVEAAFRGERQWFRSDFNHPTRGRLAVQSEYVPHRAPSGKVVGLIIVVQDVTEQRATEMALRESEERFRHIANSAPMPMWVTRADDSRDFVNQAYADFFNLVAEEAVHAANWKAAINSSLIAQRQ